MSNHDLRFMTLRLRSCLLGHAVVLGEVEELHFLKEGSSGMLYIMVQDGCYSCTSVIFQLIFYLPRSIKAKDLGRNKSRVAGVASGMSPELSSPSLPHC